MKLGRIQRTWLMLHYKRISALPDFLIWKLRGSPVRRRVPHLVKQKIVREYGQRFHLPILIETGTQYGQMIYAMRNDFRQIYSIELNDVLFASARKNFAAFRNVHLIQGDSAVELPKLLAGHEIAAPSLFWLDGHWDETPILDELRTVFNHQPNANVILIDDAHCFGSSPYYPTLESVRELTAQLCPGAVVESRDNVIRIYPQRPPSKQL